MKVKCERNCSQRNAEGFCTGDEIVISLDGGCSKYHSLPEYEPFREDNVIVFDNANLPSIMVRFSRVTNKELFGGSDKVHPMFIIGGVVYDEIYISKYPNVIINGKAYSLPMQQPAVNVTYDQAEQACFAKGEGWHLWTAAERGFLANLSLSKGTLPHGNTNGGCYHGNTDEKGITYGGGKTLTGSGPATWSHDHTPGGVYDLCGNVWEWCRGLRLMDGVIEVAENNDAAMNIDLSKSSKNWKPVLVDGEPLRVDCSDGVVILTTEDEIEEGYDGASWEDVEFQCDITEQMKELALFPGEPQAYVYFDTEGERLPICGGGWHNTAGAGVFYVDLVSPRSYSHSSLGFRSAYYRKLETE